MTAQAQDVIEFWFAADSERHWFAAADAFDQRLRENFGATLRKARDGGLRDWADTPCGALALVIVLDQFPRNIHRGSAAAFASDADARAVARAAIQRGFDDRVDAGQRSFFYMPLMHSENLADQEECVALCRKAAEGTLPYAIQHRDLIARFGRFPHRNAVLGRDSTTEELEYLRSDGAFRG